MFKIVRSSYLRLVPQINHDGGGEDHDNEDDTYHQHCNYLGVMGFDQRSHKEFASLNPGSPQPMGCVVLIAVTCSIASIIDKKKVS